MAIRLGEMQLLRATGVGLAFIGLAALVGLLALVVARG